MSNEGIVLGIGYGNRKHIAGPPVATSPGRRASDRTSRTAVCSSMVVLDFLENDPHLPPAERRRLETSQMCGTCTKRVKVEKCSHCGGSGLEPNGS